MSVNTLKTIYYSYFNTIISYGLPFWGNSPHSVKIFRIQKKIRIMIGCKSKVSCRNLFRRLEILPLVSQYVLLRMLFVVKNKNLFILNSENHTRSRRQSNNFYQPITNFIVYKRGVYYMVSKDLNNLPPYIKDISSNARKFEMCLKRFLHIHSFYSIEEYFQYKSITSQ